jgi:small neutral amino acid transporter SnatA (MarC family)
MGATRRGPALPASGRYTIIISYLIAAGLLMIFAVFGETLPNHLGISLAALAVRFIFDGMDVSGVFHDPRQARGA